MSRFSLLMLSLALGACAGKDDDTTPTESAIPEVDEDGDGATGADDCDDNDASRAPGLTEVCDGVDNNCDGDIDEGVTITYYFDDDTDGYGDLASTTAACSLPAGYAATSTDCDDNDPSRAPGLTEVCDGVDNDCDNAIDEGVTITYYLDADADNFGDPAYTTAACSLPAGYAATSPDCDDGDNTVYPGAAERCEGLDNDCDGAIDEGVQTSWFKDGDGDGHGDATNLLESCDPPDGYASSSDDCDDTTAKTFPGAAEYCDGVDTDCDGLKDEDEGDAIDADVYYKDADGDTYGDPGSTTTSCSLPTGYVTDSSDCEDGAATAYPGSTATETPNDGVDQDCDGADVCTDLNCDGLPDVVLAQHYTGSGYTGSLYLYMNQGSGKFSSAKVTTLTSYGSWGYDVADLDQDGYQDVVIANYYNDSSYSVNSMVYWGSAAGYSTADSTALATVGSSRVLIEDLNLDGWDDLTFVSYYNGSNYGTESVIYFGSASGFSKSSTTTLSTPGAVEGLVEDLDNDGYPDLVFCSYYSSTGSIGRESYIYWGSSGGYSSSDRTGVPTLGCYDVDTADFNNDGYTDIAYAQYHNGSAHSTSSYVYYGSASGYSSADQVSLTAYSSLEVEVGDFDGDGYDDVAFGGYYAGSWSSTAYTMIYYGSALGLSSSVYDALSSNGAQNIQAEDINKDGYTDLVVPHYYNGSSHSTTSYVYYGSATGMSSTNRDSMTTGVGPVSAAVGDLSGDGYPDIVFGGYRSDSWSSTAYSLIFNGSASGYSSTASVNSLADRGVWAAPVLVGNTAW